MPFVECAGSTSVFKIYCFQILPAKYVPFSCERPMNHIFTVFSMCQYRVNAVILLHSLAFSSTSSHRPYMRFQFNANDSCKTAEMFHSQEFSRYVYFESDFSY